MDQRTFVRPFGPAHFCRERVADAERSLRRLECAVRHRSPSRRPGGDRICQDRAWRDRRLHARWTRSPVWLCSVVVARLRSPPGWFWVDLDRAGGSIDGHGVEYLGFEERCEARRAEPPADAHAAREQQVAEPAFRRDVAAEGAVAVVV